MCKIICITALSFIKGDVYSQLDAICRGGIDRLILREKTISENEYKELAVKVSEICGRYDTPLSLHTFADTAKELGSESIHLSYHDFMDGKGLGFSTVGVSVHSPEEAEKCGKMGASYITAGHVFVTDCKKGLAPRGTEYLKKVCRSTDIPVYAIGGISPENADQCIKAGAEGICVMSSLMTAPHPEEYIRQLRDNMLR